MPPGGSATASFADSLLVPVSFHKLATGNYNPTQLILGGAVIDVTEGTVVGGATVATCTTDAGGYCTTAPTLVSGQPYCWQEVDAPAGLQSGASGCFTASNSQGAQPITVDDPGLFVSIAVKKVAVGDPTFVLPGAAYDLFRVDDGSGPNTPAPPTGAPAEPGQTWVARATTGADGVATFPLQFPGYAYCVVEFRAPPNYVLNTAEHCTGVLHGTTAVPPTLTTLTLTDAAIQISISAHKFNSAFPDTGIPGAVYDLYVEGAVPPTGPPSTPPPGTTIEHGDTWWARGTTGSDGSLSFTVPAGYAWCFHEVTAPVDYNLDPALHCTAVLTTSSPATATTVALPEVLATVYVGAHKYNALQPNTVIPGAVYELLLQGTVHPPGYDPPSPPSGAIVPDGDTYWTQGTTDAEGRLSFAVPAGYRWCLRELVAPAEYEPDTSFHCTAVLTSDSATDPTTLALPEQPVTSSVATLAFTGGPYGSMAAGGMLLIVVGATLSFIGRRRRRRHASKFAALDPGAGRGSVSGLGNSGP